MDVEFDRPDAVLAPLVEAEHLAMVLAGGAALPTLASPILLSHGESLHAQLEAAGARFHPLDVEVEQRRPLPVGGPFTFGVATALTSIANRRARQETERLAAPQWRPLGTMPVLATNQRLLLLHEGTWGSVWHSAIRQLVPRPAEGQLELIVEADSPYLLVGEWVPYLTVVMTAVLAHGYGVDVVAAMLCTT